MTAAVKPTRHVDPDDLLVMAALIVVNVVRELATAIGSTVTGWARRSGGHGHQGAARKRHGGAGGSWGGFFRAIAAAVVLVVATLVSAITTGTRKGVTSGMSRIPEVQTDPQTPGPSVGPAEHHGGPMTTATTDAPSGADVNSYSGALRTLEEIVGLAGKLAGAIDPLVASLGGPLKDDPESLSKVSAIGECADNLVAAATDALNTLQARHEQMHEAVVETPHAAPTEFYRGDE